MFYELRDWARENLDVLETLDKGYDRTILVIGERHFHPQIQCEVLNSLVALRERFGSILIGTEGSKRVSTRLPGDVDPARALGDPVYMRELLARKINALRIFRAIYPDVRVQPVDDRRLRELALLIDTRCQELYECKRKKTWDGMTQEERRQYLIWFRLIKEILLGDRSDAMVQNLIRIQTQQKTPIAVLICGAAHTPFHVEHRAYSVVRTLAFKPVNYVIAVNRSFSVFRKEDPFDFWTSIDSEEDKVNPYNSAS